MNIRNSAKALLVQDGKLLAIKKLDAEGEFYILPGGGQEHGENLQEALKRECIEEVGLEVEVGDLRFIREYIGKNHEYASDDSMMHQVEFMFACTAKDPQAVATNGSNPDDGQVGVDWLAVEDLLNYRLYPLRMREEIIRAFLWNTQPTIYLGDIN